jgi:hypothetical protein
MNIIDKVNITNIFNKEIELHNSMLKALSVIKVSEITNDQLLTIFKIKTEKSNLEYMLKLIQNV